MSEMKSEPYFQLRAKIQRKSGTSDERSLWLID
jgi:hypothetical protein